MKIFWHLFVTPVTEEQLLRWCNIDTTTVHVGDKALKALATNLKGKATVFLSNWGGGNFYGLSEEKPTTRKKELSEKISEKLTAVMKRPQDFLIYCTLWLTSYIVMLWTNEGWVEDHVMKVEHDPNNKDSIHQWLFMLNFKVHDYK